MPDMTTVPSGTRDPIAQALQGKHMADIRRYDPFPASLDEFFRGVLARAPWR